MTTSLGMRGIGPVFLLNIVLIAPAMAETPGQTYGKLPISFEENAGQASPAAHYLARGRDYTLLLESRDVVLGLRTPEGPAAVRMHWLGAAGRVRIEAEERMPAVSNYLVGRDRSRWLTGVAHYARVRYRDLYPGIDAVFYGNDGRLEYDLAVAPGADLERIRFQVQGADSIQIDAAGDLHLGFRGREIVHRRPVVYQQEGNRRRSLNARYRRTGETEIGFEVDGYDRSRPLVIDPVVTYASYLGGGGSDTGNAIAVDSQGSAYIVGTTLSADFPVAGGGVAGNTAFSYAFVSKLSPAGDRLIYSTYIGGELLTEGRAVAVDGSYVYVAGFTRATQFPTVNAIKTTIGGSGDAFVAKLTLAGDSVAYSTLLGGSDEDQAHAIAVDPDGNAYVAGRTFSSDFPVSGGAQRVYGGNIADGFVVKLSAAGRLVYGTYVGGGGDEDCLGIALDSARAAYIVGYTTAGDFPRAPYQNTGAFTVKIAPDGSAFQYSLVFGPTMASRAYGVAVDSAGNAFVVGRSPVRWLTTSGTIQPSYGGGNYDAFVMKINAAGNALLYSTYLGGSGEDAAYAVAIDAAGNAYVAGETTSSNFPVSGSLQPALGGGYDVFVAKLNPGGTALGWSTLLGGSGQDSAYGMAMDASGALYLTGVTTSMDFPLEHPLQGRLAGGSDVFVAKLAGSGGPAPTCSYSISPSSFSAPAAGGSSTVAVSTSVGCAWTAASSQSWLTISQGANGSGSGTVSFQAGANTSTAARTGVLTIAGLTFTVTQAAGSGGGQSSGTALVSGVAAGFQLPAATGPTLFHGTYSFYLSVPQGATQVAVDLSAAQTVDLNLYARFGSDVALNSGAVVSDFSTSGSGASKRLVIPGAQVKTGTYYFAFLLNTAGVAVNGTITATITSANGGSIIRTLQVDDSGSGTLSASSGHSILYSGSYADAYGISVSTTRTVTITMSSGGTFVPYLILYNSAGDLVAEEVGSSSAPARLITPLAPGVYRLEVTTYVDGATGSYQLSVSSAAASSVVISAQGITNAATFLSGGVSPGEILTVFGSHIGPAALAYLQVNGTKIASTIGNTRVLVYGISAPLIFASDGQVSFVMPYFVDGLDHAQIQLEYNGNRSNYVQVPVVAASPALFAFADGQAASLNDDGTVISQSNQAQRGHYVTLFGTGEGQTTPAGVDGQIAITSFPKPTLPVRVQIGGVDAEVQYAGAAPYNVAGVFQINVKIPANITPDPQVPVVVYVGSARNGGSPTIPVR